MATERKTTSIWKSLKEKFANLMNRNRQNTLDINSQLLPSLQVAAISSVQSCPDNDRYITNDTPRIYKLSSTYKMSTKALPRYYFTKKEHFIMKQAWNIITNINETELFEEYKAILFNDGQLKSALINNGVDMREQFDIIYGTFSKIITQKEYHEYKTNVGNDDITVIAIVLKMIGIRQATLNKIIPTDYSDFGSCFILIFEKYLEEYYDIYPECRLLLNRCWKFIFESITVAFDFSD